MADATFFGDLGCGWTWLASEWLRDVAAARDLSVRWRPFALGLFDDDHAAKPKYQQTVRAARLVQALDARGEHATAARFVERYGRAVHVEGRHAGDDLALEVARATGADGAAPALDDDALDDDLRATIAEAEAIAGPDVGSPVFQVGGAPRGWFGPVLVAPVRGAAALAIWDAACALAGVEGFSELKRGRPDRPRLA